MTPATPHPSAARRRRVRIASGLALLAAIWTLLVAAFTERSHQRAFVRAPADAPPSDAALVGRLLLVGDGGLAEPGSALFSALAARAAQAPERTVVALLGDNIYPAGMPAADDLTRSAAERHLRAQLDPSRAAGAEVFVLPGNHDWGNRRLEGAAALKRQSDWLSTWNAGDETRGQLIPDAGTPGPYCVQRVGFSLIALDTNWWLGPLSADAAESELSLAALSSCLRRGEPGATVVLGHHPLESTGQHAGFAGFEEHLFPLRRRFAWGYVPLPVLGSLFLAFRELRPTPQDLPHPANQQLLAKLSSAFAAHPPLVYAAGHEHNLQVHASKHGPRFSLVSGAGSRLTGLTHGDSTLFAQEALGFMELERHASNEVWLHVFTPGQEATPGGAPQPVWSHKLH